MKIQNALRALGRGAAAAALLAATMLGTTPFAGSILINGPLTTNADGTNGCFYTAAAEGNLGNWIITCASSGTRTMTFNPAVSNSNCTSYTQVQQTSIGDFTVSGCVSGAAIPPPTVTLTSPATTPVNAAGGAAYSLKATATTSSNFRSITRVDFYREDSSTAIGQGSFFGSEYVYSWTNPPGNGSVTVYARATDSGGVTRDSDHRQIVFTNQPPQVNAAGFPPGAYSSFVGGSVTIGVTATDPETQPLTVRFYDAVTGAFIGNGSSSGGTYSYPFPTPAEGVTSIRAEVSDGFNIVNTNLSVVALQRPNATAVIPANKATVNVGVLPASLAVSDLGGAVYSIPIPVPPGPNGMQPSLSLNYNSQGGNGVMGLGWSFGGLSAITRCAPTIASNGRKDSINYDDNYTNDVYCMDGQRLVLVWRSQTGTSACGPTFKSEYRTEVESYSRIYAYEDDICNVGGPSRFEVFTKSGLWLMFGRANVSNAYGDNYDGTWVVSWPNQTGIATRPNVVKTWPLARSMDRSGNFARYEYCGMNLVPVTRACEDADQSRFPFPKSVVDPAGGYPPTEHHIKQIYYGGRANRTTRVVEAQALATVYFGYGVRDGLSVVLDQHRWFDSGGGQTTLANFLYSITTGVLDNGNWKGVLSLLPTYSYGSTGRLRMAGLRQCSGALGSNGEPLGVCITAASQTVSTTFEYQDTGTGQFELVADLSAHNNKDDVTAAADFDGDGRTDIIHVPDQQSWVKIIDPAHGYIGRTIYLVAYGSSVWLNGPQSTLADFNGDGKADLFVRTGNQYYVCDLNQPNSTTANCRILPGMLAGSVNDFYLQGDFDGDGRMDLMFFRGDNNWDIYFGDQYAYLTAPTRVTIGTPGYSPANQIAVGDFNGDGRTDVLYRTWPEQCSHWPYGECDPVVLSWTVFFSRPDTASRVAFKMRSTDAASSAVTGPTGLMGRTLVYDFNGDGIADVIHPTYTPASANTLQWTVCLSSGEGSFRRLADQPDYDASTHQYTTNSLCRQVSSTWADPSKVVFGDFDGDGKTDMAYHKGNKTWNICYARTDATYSRTAQLPSNNVRFQCEDRYVGLLPNGPEATNILMGDFDGDGKTDFLGHHNTSNFWIMRSPGPAPDLLTQVTNAYGAVTKISYLPLTNSGVYTRGTVAPGLNELLIQSPLQVVYETNASNGNGGWFLNRYRYAQLKGATNGRGLLGFESKVMSDSSGMTTLTVYNQSLAEWWKAGRPDTVYTYSNNALLSQVLHVWQQAAGTAAGVTAVNLAQTVEYKRDLDGSVLPCTRVSLFDPQTSSTAQVDAYGNPTVTVTETGTCVSPYSFAFDGGKKKATNTYINDDANWVLGRLTLADVEHWMPGNATSVLRRSRFYYHGMGQNCTGTTMPPLGHLCAEVIEPDAQPGDPTPYDLYQLTGYEYDIWGNVTQKILGYPEDGVMRTRSARVTFDATGRFPAVLFNERMHREERTYDPRFGALVSSKKYLDNVQTRYLETINTIDDFGRKMGETLRTYDGARIAETDITWARDTAISGSVYSITTKNHLKGQTKVYFDSLQREIYSETLGFDAASTALVSTVYDGLGRKLSVNRPVGSTTVTTTFGHDDLGRVTSQTDASAAAAGAPALTTTTFTGYRGLATVVNRTNPGHPDQKSITLRNSQGQVVLVIDCLGTTPEDTWFTTCMGDRVSVTTSYVYDQLGNVTSITSPPTNANSSGLTRTATYDRRGRKRTSSDPDIGQATFTYNGLGELIKHRYRQDLASPETVVSLGYDPMGRLSQRNQEGFGSSWGHDQCNASAMVTNGSLCFTQSLDASGRYMSTENLVDSYGRSYGKRVTVQQGAVVTSVDDTYTLPDTQGRPSQIVYPTLRGVRYAYSSYTGQLQSITDLIDNTSYWIANSRYPDGQIHTMSLGSTQVTKEYDGFGRPRSIVSAGGSTTHQNATYSFDAVGNLAMRADTANGLAQQNFTYDSLNRVTAGGGTSVTYDLAGNIVARDGRTYGYTTTSNRVQSVSGIGNYTYDDVGNVRTAAGATATWTGFNMPSSITKAGHTVSWAYDADRNRIQEFSSDTGTTTYLPGMERIEPTSGSKRYRHYISSPEGVIASLDTIANSSSIERKYWLRDHLSSLVATIDAATGQKVTLGYDVWGARSAAQSADASRLQAGFTGHEMLDELGLVHMNGRIYDPAIGKFLSADPFVQAPYNGQSYNRYSYVLNNPLSLTDPTGYASVWVQWRSTVAMIAVTVIMQQWVMPAILPEAFAATAEGQFVAQVASGFAAGGIAGGNIDSAVQGAFMAAFNFAIGEATIGGLRIEQVSTAAKVANVLAHGVAGCAQSTMAGGSCKGGALAGGFSAAAGFAWSTSSYAGGLARSVVIGAVASKLGGDTAENGALTAAFAYLFNDVVHRTLITLGYTLTPVRMGTNHALVIATDAETGEQYATRAGPSCLKAGGCFTGYGLGPVYAEFGPFDASFRDAPSAVHTKQFVGTLDMSLGEVATRMGDFARATNASKAPYAAAVNSNSYAFSFIDSMGLGRPVPSVWAPGWQSEVWLTTVRR